jgi:hypothetical protein
LVTVVSGALLLQFVGKPLFVSWLRAHSTVSMVQAQPGGRHKIAVYRYPKMHNIPECLGFGQGYVQLYETDSGHVLQEKVANDLAAINLFAWGPTWVSINGFAEWQTP